MPCEKCHVSRVPKPSATLRMPCEKCHVSRVPKPRQPSGCRARVPRVPSDLADRSLRMLCESATRPESPTERTLRITCECATCHRSLHQDPLPGALRVRHVSRVVKTFFQPI